MMVRTTEVRRITLQLSSIAEEERRVGHNMQEKSSDKRQVEIFPRARHKSLRLALLEMVLILIHGSNHTF